MSNKLKKFLMGAGIVAASFGAAKTAHAQEDEYGVRNMTEEEKTERLAEIKVDIDSLDRIIATKQENFDLVKEYVSERILFDEYNKKGWLVPVGEYIRDDIIKNIDEQIKEATDSVQISKLQQEKNTIIKFFNYEKKFSEYENLSIAFVANALAENINYRVRDEKLTPDEGKIIAKKLKEYFDIKKIPTASRYDVMNAVLMSLYYVDIGGLRTSYMNGEIAPQKYTEQIKKYEKIYDLLFRLLNATNKDGDLKTANSQYYAFCALKNKAQKSLMFSISRKKELLEEQNAILMPIQSTQSTEADTIKRKNKSRR